MTDKTAATRLAAGAGRQAGPAGEFERLLDHDQVEELLERIDAERSSTT